jgi:nitrogen-specific signal transduction histidine kinase/DNA-binding NarL/FixJ family response regulator
MRTLLLITPDRGTTEAVREAIDPEKDNLIAQRDLVQAENLLARGAIDVVILDVELTGVAAVRLVQEVRKAAPKCPVFVLTKERNREWEEEIYLSGAAHVLSKPIRAPLFNDLLGRPRLAEVIPPASKSDMSILSHPPAGTEQLRALEALRKISVVLTHSLNTEGLLNRFLLMLREVLHVNRAIVFLRKPFETVAAGAQPSTDKWLRAKCAIGIEQSLLDHFALSLSAGIGGYLRREGRILRLQNSATQSDREIQKEFQLTGTQVAIPIHDRQTLLGIAVFDERITGEPYSNEELALIFHMLEEVGLAIRNTWLHEELSTSHALISDILGQMTSGCMVIGSGPVVLHANLAARKLFLRSDSAIKQLEFADFPQELGSRIFTVLQSGAGSPSFKYKLPGVPNCSYQVTISPFRPHQNPSENAALVLLEDITEIERSQHLEIEASNLRLVKSMAGHLAHEIGNSLVPISTHQQLLEQRWQDEDFRESLGVSMGEAVKRITRLANQMIFLARDISTAPEPVRISQLIVDAFREAHTHHPGKVARLNFEESGAPWMVDGDVKALRHAFSEVLLNALQANPTDPEIEVNLEKDDDSEGRPSLQVEVKDSGKGFSNESAAHALDPFFSTRNVGLGLGLTVTRKIIENHHGKIEIAEARSGEHGLVRISLPLASEN